MLYFLHDQLLYPLWIHSWKHIFFYQISYIYLKWDIGEPNIVFVISKQGIGMRTSDSGTIEYLLMLSDTSMLLIVFP